MAALVFVLAPAISRGADVDALQQKVRDAETQAASLSAAIKASKAEMFAAQARAADAAAKEERLSGLLTTGRERAARLEDKLADAKLQLKRERARLSRARNALSQRLVAIYKGGVPDATDLALTSDGVDDLVARSGYVTAIQDADDALAFRVEEVRDHVSDTVSETTTLSGRADAYNAKLEGARDAIASVRATAESEAANLQAVSDENAAQISSLQSNIGGWVDDIAAAKAAAEKRAAANAADKAAAEDEVDRLFGGPYAIPTYIVLCESGGNYDAVNPSSGAGGAYQILPSTWELYGGTGLPQDATKEEQDRIAALIYADSGTSPWVCG